jgi:Sortase domain
MKFPREANRALAGIVLGSLVGLGMAVAILSSQPKGPVLVITSPPVTRPVTTSPSPAAVVVGLPSRLQVPRVGIDSPILSVGLMPDGTIATPCDPLAPYQFRAHNYSLAWWHSICNPNATAWFNQSVRPGSPGDAVIDGHVDWYHDPYDCAPNGACKWEPDIPASFANLDHVVIGDKVVVIDALGVSRMFVVDSIMRLANTATPPNFLSQDGAATLTLVTCAGVFQSLQTGMAQRLYVHATEVA